MVDNIDVSSGTYLVICQYYVWSNGGSSNITLLTDGTSIERITYVGYTAGKIYDVSNVNTFTVQINCSLYGGPSGSQLKGIYLF